MGGTFIVKHHADTGTMRTFAPRAAFLFRATGVPAVMAAVLGVLTGCASTGQPRPPSLHVPQAARDLTAQRTGNHVDLSFTMPTLSTDRQPLAGKHGAGPLTVELCRRDGPAAPCTALPTRSGAPGEAIHLRDDLPAPLRTGAPEPLRYVVRVLNAQGRTSADSRDAVAAAGAVPRAVQDLAATTVDRGIQITWRAAPVEPGTRLEIDAKSGDTQRNLTVAGDAGGAIDTAPHTGQAVTYTVFRSHTLAGTPPITAHGEPAMATVTRAADTFPPAVPTGLVAVAVQLEQTAPEIDLSWEADTEPDLAGYLVERTDTGNSDAPLLLTASPTDTVSFRDMRVQPGHTYRYTVRAQDRSGNRSRPSMPVTESLQP